jgi:hypothetical protein
VRWDNRRYAFPKSDELIWTGYNIPELILHSHCCFLLEQFFYPKPIPLHRLLEVCNTFPNLLRSYLETLIWGPGHDYGGLLRLIHLYPWREAVAYESDCLERIRSHPPDPLRVPKLKSYVQHSRPHSPIKQRKKGSKRSSAREKPSKVLSWRGGVSNAFTKLPLEILEYILVSAPTDGVRSLSKASKELRRIIPSSLGQSFWASRLEYSWAFEPQKRGESLDWRSLYFAMKKAPSECLLNRWRICGLVESLAPLLCLRWSGNSTLLPLDEKEDTIKWQEVHGLLQKHSDHRSPPGIEEEEGEGEGCRQSFSQSTFIPTMLQRVDASIIEIGDATYITGLRFAPKNGREICLGYTKGTERSLEITGVHGFIVAVGSGGIHALQFISPERQSSEWFGDPDGVPRTRRLAAYTPVTSLKAGFDVRTGHSDFASILTATSQAFKMVSIAIEDQRPYTSTGRLKGGVSLRDSALWFPDIPSHHLCLNDAYFKGRVSAASGFRPLCAVFGDANNPRPLIKVSLVEGAMQVRAIECQWDTGDVQSLGDVQKYCAGGSYDDTPYRLIRSTHGGRTATIRFEGDPHHFNVCTCFKPNFLIP